MAASDNAIQDPYMGAGGGEDYFGAGEHSLFGDPPFLDDAMPSCQSPPGISDVLDFGGFGDEVTAQASDTTQAQKPASPVPKYTLTLPEPPPDRAPANPAPQPTLTLPETPPDRVPAKLIPQSTLTLPDVPTDPALQDLVVSGGEEQDPVFAVQAQDPYLAQQQQGQQYALQSQDPYPAGPLEAQDSGAHQAVAGLGPNSAPSAPDASLYGLPPIPLNGGQFAMYPYMMQQFVPQGMPSGNGQVFGTQNLGYQGNTLMHMHMPMHLPMQGYPPTPTANPMASSPYPPQPQPQQQQQQQQTATYSQPAQINQPGRVPEGKKLTHNRKLKFDPKNDPSQIYSKPVGLRPWGPIVGEKQQHHLFEYFRSTAELKPMVTFTKDQLLTFFMGKGHPNPNRRLTVWIQNTAAQSNDRYASGTSSGKCRFEGCRAGQRTILKGFYRVAFDEFSDQTGVLYDPLQNAGYMHLHCFETLFDLGYLIHYGAARHGFAIRPDTRNFPFETRNPASITRDHPNMIHAYEEWVQRQKPRADQIEAQNRMKPPDQQYTGFEPHTILPHAQRLGCVLIDKHLSLEVKGRSATRAARGGVHIGLHRGDLDLYNRLKRQVMLRKRRERRQAEEEEEEEEEEEDEDEEGQRPRTKSRSSQSRKRRRSDESGGQGQSSTRGSPSAKRAKQNDSITVKISTGHNNDNNNNHNSGTSSNSNSNDDEDVVLDDSWLYDATAQAPAVPGLPQQQQQQQQQHCGPRTRKRSREAGGDIALLDVLRASGAPLTRSSAQRIQERLGTEPPHVRDRVLAAMPGYAAALIEEKEEERQGQGQGQAPGGVGVVHDDRLEARIGRLTRRQRRAVDVFTRRQESGLDPKRFHSF